MSEGIDVKFISPAMFTLECPTRKRRYDVTKGGGAYRCKMDRCICKSSLSFPSQLLHDITMKFSRGNSSSSFLPENSPKSRKKSFAFLSIFLSDLLKKTMCYFITAIGTCIITVNYSTFTLCMLILFYSLEDNYPARYSRKIILPTFQEK